MKQVYKSGGPYVTSDGRSYDAKNIGNNDKAPKGWNADLSKALASSAKRAAPIVQSEPTQQEI